MIIFDPNYTPPLESAEFPPLPKSTPWIVIYLVIGAVLVSILTSLSV